jgi:hypothetical protein
MQTFRPIDRETAALVGWGVRVMLVTPEAETGPATLARRIAGFGGLVEAEADLLDAVGTVVEDVVGYGLFVMDCDAYGGLAAGLHAVAMMGRAAERLPVILISREVGTQTFPEDPYAPTLLRSPLSAVSLRVGFEHALRDRLVYQAA